MAGRDALAGSPPIDTLTEFESFASTGQESTTSNTPITKSGYPYTTEIKSSGLYSINYSTQMGQTSTNNISQLIIEWRPGTTGTWLPLLDTQQQLRANGFVPWSGFSIIQLATTSVFQVRIQYANPGGGTCLIKEASITIGKVSE